MGGLVPTPGTSKTQKVPPNRGKSQDTRSPSRARVRPASPKPGPSSVWKKTETPPKRVQTVKPVQTVPKTEEVKKIQHGKHFIKTEVVFPDPPACASLSWCRGMRRIYHLRGFYAASIKVPDSREKPPLTWLTDYSVDFNSWPRESQEVSKYESTHFQFSPIPWPDPRSLSDPGFAENKQKLIEKQKSVEALQATTDEPVSNRQKEKAALLKAREERQKKMAYQQTQYEKYLRLESIDPEQMDETTQGNLQRPQQESGPWAKLLTFRLQ